MREAKTETGGKEGGPWAVEQLREEVRRGGDPRVLRGRAWVTWGAGARRSGGTNGKIGRASCRERVSSPV